MRISVFAAGLALACAAPAFATQLNDNDLKEQPGPALTAQAPPADRQGVFPLPGAVFKVPLPDGYCLSTPSYEPVFKLVAKADSVNVTDISFALCADEAAGVPMTSWGMIKTPLASLRMDTVGTRAALVAELKASAHTDEMQKLLRFNTDDAAVKDKTNLTAVFGSDFKGQAKFDELDFDDNGVYFGGVVNYSNASGGIYESAGAYSVTIVNGRMFSIYIFKKFEGVDDIAAMLAKVKVETAAFVAANGG